MTNSSSASIADELLALQQAFADELPQRVSAISGLWQTFRHQLDDEELGDELYRKVHNLAGAGGTFGVMRISHAAHELELAIKVLSDEKPADETDHLQGVQNWSNIGRVIRS